MAKIKKIQLTKSGLEELKAELKELTEVKRPATIERVAIARAHGDLKENAEYHSAKEDQGFVDNRISQIQDVLDNSEIVAQTKNHNKVGIGSKVLVISKAKSSKTKTFHIVGEFESDPYEGKISSASPIGAALLGRKVGDDVKVKIPVGEIVYTIKEIS